MKPLVALALLLAADARPLSGDVAHGDALLKQSGASVRVDGAWINRYSDDTILKLLEEGKDGFPEVDSDNLLDRWDVIAALRARNTDLRDLLQGANTIYVAETKLDDNAQERLTKQARIASDDITSSRRVFALFKLGEDKGMSFLTSKDSKKRSTLKKDKKVGYVVFTKIPGLRGGDYEAAFAVDKDIRIQSVVVRAPDGKETDDLNQAAQRFLGKGARGKYEELKAGGAGKAVGELTGPLSRAFLQAMESVYMFEAEERDYFAFD